jgi:hypothetical protein
MKTNSLKMMSAAVLTLFVFGTTVCGQVFDTALGGGGGKVIEAKQITKEEAAKKYPPPKGGGYPTGNRDPHSSGSRSTTIVTSPYPPHQAFECANVPHGGLVLDTHVNKVFVRP